MFKKKKEEKPEIVYPIVRTITLTLKQTDPKRVEFNINAVGLNQDEIMAWLMRAVVQTARMGQAEIIDMSSTRPEYMG